MYIWILVHTITNNKLHDFNKFFYNIWTLDSLAIKKKVKVNQE